MAIELDLGMNRSPSYKLELRNRNINETISFGPRRLGEAGRDIMVVKHALGVILPYASLVEPQDPNNPQPPGSVEDPNGWFDCTTGKRISNREAATFDIKLQTYLTKFQMDNQLSLLSTHCL